MWIISSPPCAIAATSCAPPESIAREFRSIMSMERSAREAEAFLAANPDVTSFQLVLTDSCGVGRGKVLRREELARVYTHSRFMPGSILGLDITGADVEETGLVWEDGDADRACWPIAGTLVRAPWLATPSAHFLVTMHELDDTPSPGDPRHALKRVIERCKADGFNPVVAVELEFYLMDRTRDGNGRRQPPASPSSGHRPSQMQAYSLVELDDLHAFIADVYAACEMQGLPARTLISEYSPGQLEIVLQHRSDALRAVDESILYKRTVRGVAAKHGFEATFMAKPYAQYSGSGMHLHMSLEDGKGGNLFASDDPEGSSLLRQAIGGMAATMAESTGIFAPNANSFRRFRRKSYAPMAPSWGVNNRSVSLRVPAGAAATRHIEHRVAGADANPYLVPAAGPTGRRAGPRHQASPA